jgi:hypothetical protein
MNKSHDYRDDIVSIIKQEVIGPNSYKPFEEKNEEYEILNETPLFRYGAGILYPKSSELLHLSKKIAEEVKNEDSSDQEDTLSNNKLSDSNNLQTTVDDENENFTKVAANSILPSAMGLTINIIKDIQYNLYVKTAIYEKNGDKYHRIPLECIFCLNSLVNDTNSLPNKSCDFKASEYGNIQESNPYRNILEKLVVNIALKDIRKHSMFVTITLINNYIAEDERWGVSNCFFQTYISVLSTNEKITSFEVFPHRDDLCIIHDSANSYIYKDKPIYAIGHGCSTEWNDKGPVDRIDIAHLPSYQIPFIEPDTETNHNLNMLNMSDDKEIESSLKQINSLLNHYNLWIETKKTKISNLGMDPEIKKIFNLRIESCLKIHERAKSGLHFLSQNAKAKTAFCLMNKAMYMQQIMYSQEIINWDASLKKPEKEAIDLDNIINTSKSDPRNWRAFQIVFILMNIISICEKDSLERDIVDLIWFPTGGGKTEAYLGLSAFTIFYRRLVDSENAGTSIIMRYTLRLLTTQQFQRASSLICAMEYLRIKMPNLIGNTPITIGMWVGGDVTPNSYPIARQSYNDIKNGLLDSNPFQILKCPCCGTQMGPVKYNNTFATKGYHIDERKKEFYFQCDNPTCFFSKNRDFNRRIPVQIIDEDIYKNPPSLLIGTVDKFAMIPWKQEAGRIFGLNTKYSLPDLIIQDELHLITGPLGSIVGSYEFLIKSLMKSKGKIPKVISSSATINKANEQIQTLYGKEEHNIQIFPQPIDTFGDTFFSWVNNEKKGRQYVGIMANGYSSYITANIRIISSLLQSINTIDFANQAAKDYYWTLVLYYNSLRELGYGSYLIDADIRENIRRINRRIYQKYQVSNKRKYPLEILELTSRKKNAEIPKVLLNLLRNLDGNSPVADICLSTNMLSVGIDIPRLSLMCVIGQPKLSAEYIQATSRVGRDDRGPGLIFTIYNPARSRDKSHFEQFQAYHSHLYEYVEPVSITPYSMQVLERTLHAIIIGFLRQVDEDQKGSHPKPIISMERISNLKTDFLEQIRKFNPENEIIFSEYFDKIINEWDIGYDSFGQLYDKYSKARQPMMVVAGRKNREAMISASYPTLTSMRTIDTECIGKILNHYPE